MTNLGSKFQCSECDTKYYDLGRDKALCPQCGHEMKKEDPLKAKTARKRPAPEPAKAAKPKASEKAASEKKASAEEE